MKCKCSCLDLLNQSLNFLFYQVLHVKNDSSILSIQSWGKELDSHGSRITDFMETLEKFVSVLHGARGNMAGHVTLTETEFGTQLDNMKSPAEYQAAGKIKDKII